MPDQIGAFLQFVSGWQCSAPIWRWGRNCSWVYWSTMWWTWIVYQRAMWTITRFSTVRLGKESTAYCQNCQRRSLRRLMRFPTVDWRAAGYSRGPFPFGFHEAFFPDGEVYWTGETLKESDSVSQSKAPRPSVGAEELPPHPLTHRPLLTPKKIHHQPRQNKLK